MEDGKENLNKYKQISNFTPKIKLFIRVDKRVEYVADDNGYIDKVVKQDI